MPRHFEPIIDNYRAIVEAVGELRIADRAMLYSLLARPGFQPEAIKAGIRKLKKSDYLVGPVWAPTDRRLLAQGRGSDVEILTLGPKGKKHLGISERERLTTAKVVYKVRSNRNRVPHELGVAAFHALILRGRLDGLWEEDWTQPCHLTYGEKKFYPDALLKLRANGRTFTYALEYERANRVFGNADHTTATEKFDHYEAAHDEGWRGWVLFLTDTVRHKDRLRQHCLETLGREQTSMFRFLADEEYRIDDPAALLKPVLISSRVDNPAVALIPS
jgi:hypothetical protein